MAAGDLLGIESGAAAVCWQPGKKSSIQLVPGDSVIVTRGGLKNLEGTVKSVDVGKGTFVMKVRSAHAQELKLQDDLEMPIHEVTKKFEVRQSGVLLVCLFVSLACCVFALCVVYDVCL